MRLIGTLPTQSDAALFSDFLLSVGMRNTVEPSTKSSDWMIWIERDDDVEQATAQLQAFRAFPSDPKYATASASANAVRKQLAASQQRLRNRHIDVRTSWSGLRYRPTPVSSLLVVLCIVVAVLTQLGMSRERGTTADRVGEWLRFQPIRAVAVRDDVPRHDPSTMFSSIARGEAWRAVTPIFLHYGPIHLLFNLSWLVSLGRLIEARKGSLFLLLLVVGSAIFSNCAEALWTVYGPTRDGFALFGGFSGVNYALFGYAWIKGRYQPYEHIGVNPQTVGLMLGWLVICMLGLIGDIANTAHVAGLAAGVAVGYWPTLRRRMKARS